MPIIPASNSGGGSSGSGGSISTLLGTAGEDISQYDVVYYTSSGTYKKSKNNGTEAEAECVGIATANIPNGSTGIIQIGLGTVTNAAWAFTPGDQLYVSGTYGSITNIVPTIIGDYVKPVGYATSATTIVFCPQDGWIVGGLSSHGSNHYPEGTDPIEVNIDSVGGRLDLVSSTRIKWSFLNSNQIKLYNPTTQRWELIRTSTEPTLVNTTNDLNETALVPNTIYDIFAEYSSPTAFNLVASRWSYGGDGANNTSESYATPVMTANNAPGPITLTGNGASGYEEFYAFNQADGSSDTTGVWVGSQLMINFGQPVCINKYKLKSRNASQKNWIAFPKTWTLEGTNGAGVYNDATGTNGWTVLQTVSQSEDLAANTWETNYHTFENNKSYLKYRIVPSASWGTGYAINELKLVAASNSLDRGN